jgi:Ni,Fe-hydrogenase I large subunit
MAITKISIDPVNRMEGHLAIKLDLDDSHAEEPSGYRVSNAELEGQLFRGFEIFLNGRDPRDAYVLCQRI